MPRITDTRRRANRAQIVAAARRCFSREGFHQTSMPDIAAEAGVSVGAPYRYFASKDDIILEIAGDAFRLIFAPIERLVDGAPAGLGEPSERGSTVAELVSAAMSPISHEHALDSDGDAVPVAELLRCAVLAWAELLRSERLRLQAVAGFELVRHRIAEALRQAHSAGLVRPEVEPERAARVVIALLHGFVLQRAAFDLVDVDGFADDVRAVLGDLSTPGIAPK